MLSGNCVPLGNTNQAHKVSETLFCDRMPQSSESRDSFSEIGHDLVTQQYFQSNLYLGVQRLASENSSRASEFLFWETIAVKSGKFSIILQRHNLKKKNIQN